MYNSFSFIKWCPDLPHISISKSAFCVF